MNLKCNLQQHCFDESVDSWCKGPQLQIAKSNAIETPKKDSSFAEDGKKVQHFGEKGNKMVYSMK